MNKATRKLDNTIQDWRLWLEDMGMDVDWDNLDEKSIELIANQVDKIKTMLNQENADSLYINGLKENNELKGRQQKDE